MNLPGVYEIFLNEWKDLQTCWIISDTHFGEDDLKGGFSNRPSDDDLVKLINSKVGKKDLLILLGDCGDIEYVKKLKGYKVLVAGNHDKGMSNYKDVFKMVFSGPLTIGEKLILSHEPINVPWAFNIHGHVHDRRHKNDKNHFNCCADVINYEPINFNQWMKSGYLAHIDSIHREIIDAAIIRKAKRGGKKIGRNSD